MDLSLASDGEHVWRHRRVDPILAPMQTVVGPFPASRRQTWIVRYHHMPATITATVRLRFAALPRRGVCMVSHTRVEVRRAVR